MAKRKEDSSPNKKDEGKTKGEISSFPSETESEKGKKTYILDTNVILNDPYCLKHFGEHNICIPIMVLEELDKFKKGNEPNNVNTREFHRIFNGFIEYSTDLEMGSLTEGFPWEKIEGN